MALVERERSGKADPVYATQRIQTDQAFPQTPFALTFRLDQFQGARSARPCFEFVFRLGKREYLFNY